MIAWNAKVREKKPVIHLEINLEINVRKEKLNYRILQNPNNYIFLAFDLYKNFREFIQKFMIGLSFSCSVLQANYTENSKHCYPDFYQ